MKISTYRGQSPSEMEYVAREVVVKNLSELSQVILKYPWSPATFKNTSDGRKRVAVNAAENSLLVLDIDEGMTIQEAKAVIKKNRFAALIGTTRSHGKDKRTKSGKVKPACDRFRVVLKLSKAVHNDQEFKAAWFAAKKLFPAADEACKSIANFFYPCNKIVGRYRGKKFTTIGTRSAALLIKNTKKSKPKLGHLAKTTLNFIENGAPDGQWHRRFFKAAIDFKEQSYPIALARSTMESKWKLDTEDIRQLNDVYQKRVPKYPPRLSKEKPRVSSEKKFPKYRSPSSEERLEQIEFDRALRLMALNHRVPFLCDAFDDVLWLTMGVTCIGGCTGDGKSTTAANIIAHYINHCQKTVLVISNEESSEDICSRVACILLRHSWHRYRKSDLPSLELKQIRALTDNLVKIVEIVPWQTNKLDMSVLEDVQAVLKHVSKKRGDYGLVLIDYLQSITESTNAKSTVEISKKFGNYLKSYGRKVPIPVVVFVQLKNRSEGADFGSRVQNDRTFVNHAVACVEVVSDYDTQVTSFKIHKDRFGTSRGKSVETNFVEGRYEPILAPKAWREIQSPLREVDDI